MGEPEEPGAAVTRSASATARRAGPRPTGTRPAAPSSAPACGTESKATLETRGAETVVVEHDLGAALRGLPDSARGWQAAKTSVRCQACQAISVFDADKVGQRCDFCGSAALVPYEQVKDAFRPESLLPLRISEPQARDRIRSWFRSLWFAPGRFAERALTDTLQGVYVPYWTFDARADATWTAEAGVVERYQIDLVAAAERSHRQMDARLRALCAGQVPGDTQRNLVARASCAGQTFKHILAPLCSRPTPTGGGLARSW